MSDLEAAESLHAHLAGNPWYVAVGVGSAGGATVLLVYVRGLAVKAWNYIPCMWQDRPVDVKSTGVETVS